MKKMLILALACLGSLTGVTSEAQTTGRVTGCSKVAANRVATSTDKPKLRSDISCAQDAADVVIKPRAARLEALEKPPVGDVTEPVPTQPTGPVVAQPAEIPTPGDKSKLLVPVGLPTSARPDVVGAFRFICTAGPLRFDDPLVFPGQPGKSHLHQFFGNTGADAYSTYESLRTTGDSTCNNILNRSAYWIPAMLDGTGKVVRPDYVSVYYKRRPEDDPQCQKTGTACVALPRGLRFIFGYDMVSGKQPTGAGYYNCQGDGATPGHYPSIVDAARFCPVGSQMGVTISAPNCWDGKRLDSPNHRDHVAYTFYGEQGYEVCPPSHPYIIPTFTLGVWYTVDASLDRSGTWSENKPTWSLSSDDMTGMGMGKSKPGTTIHADWWGAWDDETMRAWMDNCINKLLNCNAGDLGNGKQMAQVAPFAWNASPRLVPIPARP